MDRRLKGCTYNIFKYTFCPISHFAILDGSESGECFLFFPLCCVQFLSFVSWSCSFFEQDVCELVSRDLFAVCCSDTVAVSSSSLASFVSSRQGADISM